MMRGTPGMRLAFAILSPLFFFLCVVAIHGEDTRPWMAYAKDFATLYVERATAKLQEAQAQTDEKEIGRWQRVIDEWSNAKPEIAQIYLEDLKVADRCTTCHRGIDNSLFEDAPQPFRTHPGDALKKHDVTRFGCTPCHDGQGGATTTDAAHGREANWLAPMLPKAYMQLTCARCHEVTHGVAGAEVVSRGADLFMEMGCYGCHDVKGITYLPKYAPPLKAVNVKLLQAKDWIYTWLKDPAAFNPNTAMPNFKLPDEEIAKLTAFLLSLSPGKPYPRISLDGASAEEGERLFTERGCRGCHAVKADEKCAAPRVPHLAGIGSKVNPEWLDQRIADPKQDNPDASMPKLELKDEERHALVAYLVSLKRDEPLKPAPDLSGIDTEEGKKLLKQYECYGCHAVEGFEKVRPSVPDLSEFARRPVAELDFGTVPNLERTKWAWLDKKLRDPRAYESEKIKLKMPLHKLSDEEIAALITRTLAFDDRAVAAPYTVRATAATESLREMSWMTLHLHCNGCHQLGGRDAHIAQFFERKNMAPPTIQGVGARLQGQYMYEFLLEPKQIRPWLKLRMPSFKFTEPQAQAIVAGFAAAEKVANPYTYVAKENIPPDRFARGVRRFRHFKCVQCHPTSIDQGLPEDVDPEDLSINLMLVKSRLRPEWIRDFMTRPKEISGSQTRMPAVFYTVDGVPKVAKPVKDIEDITIYMMGMVEPPEETLKVEEEKQQAEEKKEQELDWTTMEY